MATSSVVRKGSDTCAVTCPSCAQLTTVPIAQLRSHYKSLNIPCACGLTLQLVCNRRRFPRKSVNLSGALLDITTHTPLAALIITDLSLGGVRFVTDYSPLSVGMAYTVAFGLDDPLRTEIREDIEVQTVYASQEAGAAFLGGENYNFELDFYLTPWALQL